jgi:2-keto-3-deoxy-L-rhamnonate aldolase RhmA
MENIGQEIKRLEDFLKTKPVEQVYMGESDYADSAVEEENRINNEIEEKVKQRIKYLKSKLKDNK